MLDKSLLFPLVLVTRFQDTVDFKLFNRFDLVVGSLSDLVSVLMQMLNNSTKSR